MGIQYFKKVLAHTLLIYMFVIWQKKIKKVCLFSFDTYWSSAGQILVLQKYQILIFTPNYICDSFQNEKCTYWQRKLDVVNSIVLLFWAFALLKETNLMYIDPLFTRPAIAASVVCTL